MPKAPPPPPETPESHPKREGRPSLPDEDKRDVLVRVMVTAAEQKQFAAKAKLEGASLSQWLRQLGLSALKTQ